MLFKSVTFFLKAIKDAPTFEHYGNKIVFLSKRFSSNEANFTLAENAWRVQHFKQFKPTLDLIRQTNQQALDLQAHLCELSLNEKKVTAEQLSQHLTYPSDASGAILRVKSEAVAVMKAGLRQVDLLPNHDNYSLYKAQALENVSNHGPYEAAVKCGRDYGASCDLISQLPSFVNVVDTFCDTVGPTAIPIFICLSQFGVEHELLIYIVLQQNVLLTLGPNGYQEVIYTLCKTGNVQLLLDTVTERLTVRHSKPLPHPVIGFVREYNRELGALATLGTVGFVAKVSLAAFNKVLMKVLFTEFPNLLQTMIEAGKAQGQTGSNFIAHSVLAYFLPKP